MDAVSAYRCVGVSANASPIRQPIFGVVFRRFLMSSGAALRHRLRGAPGEACRLGSLV
jgi:hypothetical protein